MSTRICQGFSTKNLTDSSRHTVDILARLDAVYSTSLTRGRFKKIGQTFGQIVSCDQDIHTI